MADAITPNYQFTKPEVGASDNSWGDKLNANWDKVDNLLAQLMPPGMISARGTATVPTGWLYCNGQAVSRTTYAKLFAAIGVAFGGGNGTTTFNVPDLRGQFLRGWDNGRNLDTGRVLGTNQTDQVEAHTHTISVTAAGGHSHSVSGTTGNDGSHTHTVSGTAAAAGSHTHPIGSQYTGFREGGGATANFVMPTGSSFISDPAGQHTHSVSGSTNSAPNHNHSFSANTSSVANHTHSATATNFGSGTENRPTNVAVAYFIKT